MIKTMNLQRALFVSILGLIFYQLGFFVEYPMVSKLTNSDLGGSAYIDFFALGLGPFLTGFLVVELFTFFLYPLKNWRKEGFTGRHKINLTAIIVSFIVGGVQAYQMTSFVTLYATNESFFLLFTFYMIGLSTLFLIGRFMTKYGIGNGYGLLIVYGILYTSINSITKEVELSSKTDQKIFYVGYLLFVFCVLAIYRVVNRDKEIEIKVDSNKFKYQLPRLPQGLFVFSWTAQIASLPVLINLYWNTQLNFGIGTWNHLLLSGVILVIISFFTNYIAFSWPRIQKNIPKIQKLDQNSLKVLSRDFYLKLFAITLLMLIYMAPRPFESDAGALVPQFIYFSEIFIVLFVVKDFLGHFSFARRNKSWVEIGDFDNIHYIQVIQQILEKHGVEAHIKGFHLRRLYAFVAPLYKMSLVVNIDDKERAQAIVKSESIEII